MSVRYLLRIAKTAEKELAELQAKQFKQVVAKIFSLQSEPKPNDCGQLKGHSGGYRVDQGEYRILYYIVEETAETSGEIQVFRVGKRNDAEVYRNL